MYDLNPFVFVPGMHEIQTSQSGNKFEGQLGRRMATGKDLDVLTKWAYEKMRREIYPSAKIEYLDNGDVYLFIHGQQPVDIPCSKCIQTIEQYPNYTKIALKQYEPPWMIRKALHSLLISSVSWTVFCFMNYMYYVILSM